MNPIRIVQLTIALLAGGVACHAQAQAQVQIPAPAPASVSVPAASTAAQTTQAANAGKTSPKAADRALRRRILTALSKAKGLRAAGITVRASAADGDVLLEGWVPEEAQIEQATRVAQDVPGVKSVRNTLTLSTF
ncbi:BON domain-containing protein [Caballeronia sp. J97]|uniref:BON domain-containing protein n=1 Tax=Caballeronia sp. J97 TaxID=2805429 RepID=UPI002AB2C834|nr:BON domain-containing protein [Caballeronia sp. J97]